MRLAGGIISLVFAVVAIITNIMVMAVGEVGKAVSEVDPTSKAGKELHTQASDLSTMATIGIVLAVLVLVFAIIVIAAKQVWPPAVVLVLTIGLIAVGSYVTGGVALLGGVLGLIGGIMDKGKAKQQPAAAAPMGAPGYAPQQGYPQQGAPQQGYPQQYPPQGGPGPYQGQG
jgi:hypothetical protein